MTTIDRSEPRLLTSRPFGRERARTSPEQIASLIDHDPPSGIARRSTSYEYDPRGHLIRQLFSSGEVIERQSDAAGSLFKSRDGSDRMYGRDGVLESAGGTLLNDRQALSRIRQGKDVFVDTMSEAKSLAKRALVGKPMHHEPHEGRIYPHFHPAQHANDSHIFYPPP